MSFYKAVHGSVLYYIVKRVTNMAKEELRRIEIVTSGDIKIDNGGISLKEGWSSKDLDNVFRAEMGLEWDTEVVPVEFNAKITITVEEIGYTKSNVTIEAVKHAPEKEPETDQSEEL